MLVPEQVMITDMVAECELFMQRFEHSTSAEPGWAKKTYAAALEYCRRCCTVRRR